MAHFILIHGAFHGGWCWEQVVPLLESEGHTAEAPDLPGMGDDHSSFADDVLAQWAEFVASRCQAADQPVVLVGHSRGGIVISAAAELVPNKIQMLIYVAAFLLLPGESLIGMLSARPDIEPLPSTPSGDGRTLIFDRDQAHGTFYGQLDASSGLRLADRLTPEPIEPNLRPLFLSPENYGRVVRSYLIATEDRAIPPSVQEQMAQTGGCTPIVHLPSDHSPFYSMPRELARSLIEMSEQKKK